MSDIKEVKIRQLLLREFRANRTVDQAYKTLRFIFGPLSITRSAVSHWFKNFKNGKTEIFDDDLNEANLNLISDEMLKKNSNAMLLHLDKEGKDYKMTFVGLDMTIDGRNTSIDADGRMMYSIGYDREKHQPTFVITDLFHGKSKSIFFSNFSSDSLKMIDNERFLLFDRSFLRRLFLLKLNNANWTVEILHSVAIEIRMSIRSLFLDQQNNRKFILVGASKVTGEIKDDQIVLGVSQHDDAGLFDGFCYTKLDNNKLCTLKQLFNEEEEEEQLFEQQLLADQEQQEDVPIVQPLATWRYNEIDLATSIENSYDVQMVYANSDEAIFGVGIGMLDRVYEWFGNRLYTFRSSLQLQQKIIAFDTDTRLWFDVGISFLDSIEKIHIDSNQHLTVKTFGPDSKKVFYRFALKKPDKLSNIAFLAMSRKFKWDAPQTYEQMIRYIPLNSSLQCQIPVENVNDQE